MVASDVNFIQLIRLFRCTTNCSKSFGRGHTNKSTDGKRIQRSPRSYRKHATYRNDAWRNRPYIRMYIYRRSETCYNCVNDFWNRIEYSPLGQFRPEKFWPRLRQVCYHKWTQLWCPLATLHRSFGLLGPCATYTLATFYRKSFTAGLWRTAV